jgi:hypothetical protein
VSSSAINQKSKASPRPKKEGSPFLSAIPPEGLGWRHGSPSENVVIRVSLFPLVSLFRREFSFGIAGGA